MDLQVSPDEAVAFLTECVTTKTVNPPGDEARLTAVLAARLAADGIRAQIQPIGPGRANLLARLPGSGDYAPLVLSAHTDTVGPGELPWQRDPWSGNVEGDRLYGRGASDMKSGLAAMALTLIALRRAGAALRGDVVLAASAGEEVNCLGARAFAESHALDGAGTIVVGEPTGGRVASAHKGAMWVAVTTSGKTAHGSMPDQGINAVIRMAEVVTRLNGLRIPHTPHPALGSPTLSINTIRGGSAVNVVPDRCRIDVDVRTVPGVNHEAVPDVLRAACVDLGYPVEIETLMSAPAVQTDAALPAVKTAVAVANRLTGRSDPASTVPYFTDGSVYQQALGAPVIIYGPGEARLAHQPDEWVALPAYLQAIHFYTEYARALLG